LHTATLKFPFENNKMFFQFNQFHVIVWCEKILGDIGTHLNCILLFILYKLQISEGLKVVFCYIE